MPKAKIGIFKSAFQEWINGDLTIIIYVVKLTIAALIAMSVSMFLNLSSPQTSVFTVFIVMQMYSGMVFSKSFYRFLGTVIGFIISLVLTSAFSQDRVWFMGFFTIWIAICAAAGFKYRNFISYGFVLSGYTVALIVLPNIHNPLSVYGFAVERFSEVVVGLLSASVISEVVFPKKLSDTLFISEKQRYKNIFIAVLDTNNIFSKESNTSNFSKNILGSDALRVNSIFESNINKKDKMYYQRLNSEFMHLSVTFHSLKNIISTISNNEKIDKNIILSLQEIYEPIKNFLEKYSDDLFEYNVENIINEFDSTRIKIKEKIGLEREKFKDLDFDLQNDFNSSSFLILRFFDEFSQYTKTYISFLNSKLKNDDSEEVSQIVKFSTYTDNLLVILASFRAAIVLIVMTIFWIITAWGYAPFAIISAVATTLMFSSIPNPINASKSFLKGSIVSFFVAGIYNFYLIPTYVSDIPTFCFVMAPVFAIAAWLGTSPQRGLFAFGFIFIIITVCSMNLYYSMDYITYFETSISSLIGIIVAGVAYELINSWSESWTKRRVSNLLVNRIIKLTYEKKDLRRVVLESRGLDLIQHFSTQGRLNTQSNTLIFQWLLSSIEIARAIIDIKNLLKEFKTDNQPKFVYEILDSIKDYFSLKDENKKERIFFKIKEDFIELEKNRVYKSAIEQRVMQNILIEISLIYTLMLNKISLPSKGEIR
ncbi:FUSC family protein [Arcobacter defluvii]|uniref:Fusaric acid resistance efflux pump, inner membrane transporter n=1 Tax=Arcobacter defluvii TaxID=873191 RepID=A0AAE7E7W5_9BACT|nr:FUSC family protein [Arcobacter defluvii]QKF78666.1 putative fusaric acid resistance efflux pump, inner membrane transporter [Arcobacter defluvii]RXI34020.1 hypothetical protein CP964_04070 [Arcobacter defluvii]